MLVVTQNQSDGKRLAVCVFDRPDIERLQSKGCGALTFDGAEIGMPGTLFVFGFEESQLDALATLASLDLDIEIHDHR